MRDKNPMDSTSIERDKSWHSNGTNARLGFVNRDALTSEHIPAPMVIYPLGRVYQPQLESGNAKWGAIPETAAVWRDGVNPATVNNASIPGIMTFQFEPIFGQSSASAATTIFGLGDIYINKWTELRILNNMTQQFQPGDLQAVTAQLMNIKMHVENIRRALRIMQGTTMSSTSAFHSPEALLAACGWHMNEEDMRTNFYKWRDFFNRSIVGNLNNVRWIKDLVPGMDRWASLCSEIYKDTSADTDYCQLMLLRPKSFYTMRMVQDEHGVHNWTFAKLEPLTELDYPWEISPSAMSETYYSSSAAVQRFQNYLHLVAKSIRDTFYDDSTMNILATLNAIEERKMSSSIEIYREQIDPIDLEPNPIEFTWDFKMMLALHNATILPVEPGSATVHGDTGVLEQRVSVRTTPGSEPAASINGIAIAQAGRALNLPCFGTTNADFANATQWTIAPRRRNDDWMLRWNDYGTEIIDSCFIWHFIPYIDEQSQQRVHIKGYYFTQAVPLNMGGFEELSSAPECFESMAEASSFAFAPLMYGIKTIDNNGTLCVSRVIGQNEVLYAPTVDVLNSIHEQWTYNFWGYPVQPTSIGAATFEISDANSR